jgi:glycosyltransferase involved in cell wall biosynthesis
VEQSDGRVSCAKQSGTWPLVILEALACGIPVAAHDVMGPRDIIDNGVDGIIGEDLEEAALACLELDPGKCREKALRYSWDSSAAAFKKNLVRASGARAAPSDSSAAPLRAVISP